MSGENFDLLSTIEYGGCSAKIGAGVLKKLLSAVNLPTDERVMVDISSADDAGVYRLNDTTALIVTTDFFPPVCSNAYEFGQIAAANSLSDVYAMGGKPLLVLNLNMFPSTDVPIEVLRDILLGGQSKINEAGALTMGGHTIEDSPVKYGLAVVGIVAPDRVITNAGARAGDVLILTKPLGAGVLVAAHRMGIDRDDDYRAALDGMKRLNDRGAELMQKYNVRGATDVTGFGLAGHLLSMMRASGTTAHIECSKVPVLDGAMALLRDGCIPGAAFRNLEFVRNQAPGVDDDAPFEPNSDCATFEANVSVEQKMLVCDAQTSGGLLISVPADMADALLIELRGIRGGTNNGSDAGSDTRNDAGSDTRSGDGRGAGGDAGGGTTNNNSGAGGGTRSGDGRGDGSGAGSDGNEYLSAAIIGYVEHQHPSRPTITFA